MYSRFWLRGPIFAKHQLAISLLSSTINICEVNLLPKLHDLIKLSRAIASKVESEDESLLTLWSEDTTWMFVGKLAIYIHWRSVVMSTSLCTWCTQPSRFLGLLGQSVKQKFPFLKYLKRHYIYIYIYGKRNHKHKTVTRSFSDHELKRKCKSS